MPPEFSPISRKKPPAGAGPVTGGFDLSAADLRPSPSLLPESPLPSQKHPIVGNLQRFGELAGALLADGAFAALHLRDMPLRDAGPCGEFALGQPFTGAGAAQSGAERVDNVFGEGFGKSDGIAGLARGFHLLRLTCGPLPSSPG